MSVQYVQRRHALLRSTVLRRLVAFFKVIYRELIHPSVVLDGETIDEASTSKFQLGNQISDETSVATMPCLADKNSWRDYR